MKRIAIITGGRTGIGSATVKRFITDDFSVINLSRRASNINGCRDLIADFTKSNWINELLPELESELQGANFITLVHNAGIHCSDTADQINEDDLQQSFAVNVIAPAILNKAVIPYMSKGSSIIYIGSTLSEKAVPGCASYITSKHAVVGLMRSTCQDLAGQSIHTACVCPGFTDTEMLRTHVGSSEEILKQIASQSTQNRLITPAEIADTIYFCAQNPVLNGSLIHANLGQVER